MSRFSMLQESMQSPSLPSSDSTFAPPSSRVKPLQQSTLSLRTPHRLFVPEKYEPSYDYPLVVWLHSQDSSEYELDGVMSALSVRNYIGIAPRANLECLYNDCRFQWGLNDQGCDTAAQRVWDCVQAATRGLSVNPQKIFLAGFGTGGTIAQWIGLKYARQIAGVVSLSGAFPTSTCALSNWKKARQLKVMFAQLQGSTLCTDEELVQAVRIAHHSGLDYQFLQCRPDDDIELSTPYDPDSLDRSMLDAANRFLMGIVTETQISLAPESTCDSERIEFGFN